jgi:hypothetical protein
MMDMSDIQARHCAVLRLAGFTLTEKDCTQNTSTIECGVNVIDPECRAISITLRVIFEWDQSDAFILIGTKNDQQVFTPEGYIKTIDKPLDELIEQELFSINSTLACDQNLIRCIKRNPKSTETLLNHAQKLSQLLFIHHSRESTYE